MQESKWVALWFELSQKPGKSSDRFGPHSGMPDHAELFDSLNVKIIPRDPNALEERTSSKNARLSPIEELKSDIMVLSMGPGV